MSVHTAAAHIIVNKHIEEAMRREQNRPSFGQWYIPPNVVIKSGALCNGNDE